MSPSLSLRVSLIRTLKIRLFLPVSACLSVAGCVSLCRSPTLLPGLRSSNGPVPVGPHPNPDFPGASWRGPAPALTDQRSQLGRGLGPAPATFVGTVPFASTASGSAGVGSGGGVPGTMSRRVGAGVGQLGRRPWGKDRVASPCSPLGIPPAPVPAVPRGDRTAPSCSEERQAQPVGPASRVVITALVPEPRALQTRRPG